MALGTNFYMDLLLGGTGNKCVAAVAGNGCLIISGMDSFFHLYHLSIVMDIIFGYISFFIRTAYGTTNSVVIVAQDYFSCNIFLKNFPFLYKFILFYHLDELRIVPGAGKHVKDPVGRLVRL